MSHISNDVWVGLIILGLWALIVLLLLLDHWSAPPRRLYPLDERTEAARADLHTRAAAVAHRGSGDRA